MPLENIASKLKGNIGKIGGVVGYIAPFSELSESRNTPLIKTLIEEHRGALKFHLHDALSQLPYYLSENKTFQTLILLGLGGYVSKEIGVFPSVGNLAYRFAKTAVPANIAGWFVALLGSNGAGRTAKYEGFQEWAGGRGGGARLPTNKWTIPVE